MICVRRTRARKRRVKREKAKERLGGGRGGRQTGIERGRERHTQGHTHTHTHTHTHISSHTRVCSSWTPPALPLRTSGRSSCARAIRARIGMCGDKSSSSRRASNSPAATASHTSPALVSRRSAPAMLTPCECGREETNTESGAPARDRPRRGRHARPAELPPTAHPRRTHAHAHSQHRLPTLPLLRLLPL